MKKRKEKTLLKELVLEPLSFIGLVCLLLFCIYITHGYAIIGLLIFSVIISAREMVTFEEVK